MFRVNPALDIEVDAELNECLERLSYCLLADLQLPAYPSSSVELGLWQDGESFYVECELPEVASGQLEIEVRDNVVEIRTITTANDSAPTVRRSIELPLAVDVARVGAEFKDGLLTIVLPKVTSQGPHLYAMNPNYN